MTAAYSFLVFFRENVLGNKQSNIDTVLMKRLQLIAEAQVCHLDKSARNLGMSFLEQKTPRHRINRAHLINIYLQ